MNTLFKLIWVITLVAFLIVIGPLATIWALNTLFPSLSIPYTVYTWLAAAVLMTLPQVKVKR